MLETAFQCFQGASRCEGDSDEEEWLIHYMLGKIAEKRKQPPVEYLQLYKKVNSCGDLRLHIYPRNSVSDSALMPNFGTEVFVCSGSRYNVSVTNRPL